jgi:hypothetical protein
MYYQMCTTLLRTPSIAPITEGEFSTIAVDKTVEKHVRIAGERCYACAATRRL